MIKQETAFKHPNCGGVILQYEENGVVFFECDQCAEKASDIDHLIIRGLVIIRTGSTKLPASKQTDGDDSEMTG